MIQRHKGCVPGDMELTRNVVVANDGNYGNGEGDAGNEEENGNEKDVKDVENAQPNSSQ